MSDNRELREWLGLTSADLLVYLSVAALVPMFFVRDAVFDALLALGAIGFAVAACPIGMTRDPQVSNFTNAVKYWSYPVWLLLALGTIAAHYVWFR
jgi:hypothetical protein